MIESTARMAREIAQAAVACERRRTGDHIPSSVTVVLTGCTLVITLHEALTPAERALVDSPTGPTRMRELHRQLFELAAEPLYSDIERITGLVVREAASDVAPPTGAMVHAFANGNVVQVFQLSAPGPTETWTGSPSLPRVR